MQIAGFLMRRLIDEKALVKALDKDKRRTCNTYILSQTKWLFVVVICFAPALSVQPRGHDPAEAKLAQQACLKHKCTTGDLCYIAHPHICNKFIMCSTNELGQLYSQMMPCAFGTFWNSTKESCETSHLVDCPNDPCRQPGVKSYGHDDTNCRTYWRCVDGHTSIAKCCRPFHSYDQKLDKCVKDASCEVPCPILDQEVCAGRGVETLHFPDNNCKTYWNCTGSPHPVCCKDGWSYDKFTGRCVVNASCTDPCPKDYQDICSKRGVKSYYADDGNCRTYMKCNKKGLDDPYCCRPGQEYHRTLKTCVPTKDPECLRQTCPGFFEECHLLPVAGDKSLYNNTLANNLIMPCPVGTIFTNCGCDRDPNYIVDTSVCSVAIHAKLPDLKNHGKVTATLLMIGEYGQGETGVGQMANVWDGTTGINIPYFGTQAPYKFHLQIIFQPLTANRRKQVLLSSCEYLKTSTPNTPQASTSIRPTLELSIDQLSEVGGNMTLELTSPDAAFTHTMPYQVNELYRYDLIYDGKKVASILEPNNRVLSVDDSYSPFTGPLAIGRGGLRFAHCRYEPGVDSFIGTVSEIQISKCLTQALKDKLYPVTVV